MSDKQHQEEDQRVPPWLESVLGWSPAWLQDMVAWKEQQPHLYRGVLAGLLVLVVTNFRLVWLLVVYILHWNVQLVKLIVGVALGIALGLGWALYVYDALQHQLAPPPVAPPPLGERKRTIATSNSTTAIAPNTPLSSHRMVRSSSSSLYETTNYESLMNSAGYYTAQYKRGQVVKVDDEKLDVYYKYSSKALQVLTMDWSPQLPHVILEQLARLMEYVVRDYVASWYCMVDTGCPYTLATPSTTQEEDEPTTNTQHNETEEPNADNHHQDQKPRRTMILSTASQRPLPLMEVMYKSLSAVFGNLAVQLEHVNLFKLVLLDWTKILALTFQSYRSLRTIVLERQVFHNQDDTTNTTTHCVSEMAMTRELLLAGKLHMAVTFGLDVPSLLFADANGRECGPSNNDWTDDQVLQARLFDTPILYECELDYNRVLAHRIVRAILPRNEYSSALISSVVTEILAGSVLTPIMSCFTPEYLNGWICSALEGMANTATSAEADETRKDANGDVDHQDEDAVDEGIEVAAEDVVLKAPSEDIQTDENVLVVEPEDKAVVDVASSASSTADCLLTLLTMALIDLQTHVDLEVVRQTQGKKQVDYWDNPSCRAAVVRIVLVLEAVLLHGRCDCPKVNPTKEPPLPCLDDEEEDDSDAQVVEDSVEMTLPEYEALSLPQLLMDMTSDLDAFEDRVAREVRLDDESEVTKQHQADCSIFHPRHVHKPSNTELSTLRTLIAAWLHTGASFRTLSILIQAHSVLTTYYHDQAFLRDAENSRGFVRQLKVLDGMDIMVDTTAVLASASLDIFKAVNATNALETNNGNTYENSFAPSSPTTRSVPPSPTAAASSSTTPQYISTTTSTPRHLDFNRNANFALSLRTDREKRLSAWENIAPHGEEDHQGIVCRVKGASEEDTARHRELHQVARFFYAGTNLLAIRDGALRQHDTADAPVSDLAISLLTVEMAYNRRRLEIPDDDSSFLLRAQPRALNPVGVHRAQLNHDQSFKCYAATYEEPAFASAGAVRYSGGKYIRRCLLRYFPIDRTASITIQNDKRKLDQRRHKSAVPDTINLRDSSALTGEFLRERHLCQKWNSKTSAAARSGSILASTVMEPTDFNAVPRSGRALDFIYRMSLFERPIVELAGKRFSLQESATFSQHRADGSSLEMSDAALSTALLIIGRDWVREDAAETSDPEKPTSRPGSLAHKVEMGPDGYPVVWMKANRKQGGGSSNVEIKPYRASYVRAALMITCARQEAQLQSLVKCVKAGSAKSATKARTEAHLKPTLKLLDYANTRSREKQSVLLRDLKLGINHIDREQLRRNALLDPRYPAVIRELSVVVEGGVPAAEVGEAGSPTTIVYKIRCEALVELLDVASDEVVCCTEDGTPAKSYKESWVVFRPFKDFQTLHKHLKTQVASSESSGSAGSRLVGAATAAFSTVSTAAASQVRSRHRKALVPSLGQANKAGALGVTKSSILKSIQKRQELLDGYLRHFLAPDHPMHRCPELMLFLGGFYPLPVDVQPGQAPCNLRDPLGRTEMTRTVVEKETADSMGSEIETLPTSPAQRKDIQAAPSGSLRGSETLDTPSVDAEDDDSGTPKEMILSIASKVNEVPLGLVRNRIFELIRYQFGFENASFVRSRMLSALKTVSFAYTSSSEFRKKIYNLHVDQLNADALADWIKYGVDMLWPNGVIFESSPEMTPEEAENLSNSAKEMLQASFPDQVRTILGQELTKDGLAILHEMFQNRILVKSLAYMLFDLLWLEVFPEIRDILSCGAAIGGD